MRLGLDDDVTLGATGSVAMASALLVNRDDRLGPSDILTRGAIKKKVFSRLFEECKAGKICANESTSSRKRLGSGSTTGTDATSDDEEISLQEAPCCQPVQ